VETVERVWLFLTAWPRGFVGWVHAAFCALLTPEGRRGWAVILAWGCAIVESVFVAVAIYLNRTHPMLVFWLGCSAQFIVVIVMTAITGLLVKRDIGGSLTKDGATFNAKDQGVDEG
jgi:hypothetical protein